MSTSSMLILLLKFFLIFCAKLDISNINFHLKICIELDIVDANFCAKFKKKYLSSKISIELVDISNVKFYAYF